MEPHAGRPVVEAGASLGRAPAAVIMVHGRNAGPANILDLVPRLARPNLTYLAPAAANRTWYPYSFMAEIASNEPGLSSGLNVLESLLERTQAAGLPRSRIVLLGVSQGACLTAEFAVRSASRFRGTVVFSGGVIGPPGTRWDYAGRFDGTPVFLGGSDHDSHVPESRVIESAELFTRMGAAVTTHRRARSVPVVQACRASGHVMPRHLRRASRATRSWQGPPQQARALQRDRATGAHHPFEGARFGPPRRHAREPWCSRHFHPTAAHPV